MPRALQPHTPDAELDAFRAQNSAGGASVLITPDLEGFCQGGVSVFIAAALPGEMPVTCIGHGCRVLPCGIIRLLLPSDGGAGVLALAARGAGMAATFSQPHSHRSIQLKGTGPRIVAATNEDRQWAQRQKEGLGQELISVYYSPTLVEAYCHVEPSEVVAIEFELQSAFAQTPGPGAGAELK